MAFDFLPKLPKSNLDDRTFDDLMDEALLRIPRYCPEWTNYNPSDPGVTLIELFAWMTEQMLQRFNQVPQRNYITFLELLGIRLQPPVPAQTDLTFYLNTALPEPLIIPGGIEVATLRTETEPAIVFSTDRPLVIGTPQLAYFLTAETPEETPQTLRDRLSDIWTQDEAGRWTGFEQPLFEEQPQPGNCFYLVLDADQQIEANVVAITFQGEAATTTGINPNSPPRRWEAWDGFTWRTQGVLRQEADDHTQGFSFNELSQRGLNALQGADVVLHLPKQFPVTNFQSYRGRWLRCVCIDPNPDQPAYSRSPRIVGLSVRAIGGTVAASQCTAIQNEVVGVSDGLPGQVFQAFGVPILPRRPGERLEVIPPEGLPQTWQEVTDFADSSPNDLHYVIDSVTGTIQFGPLIREPAQIQQETQLRHQIQTNYRSARIPVMTSSATLDRQYGSVPPRGSVIRMVSYRTGGGQRGNVQQGSLSILKTAIPYVASVTNHEPARYGRDAESLEQAAIRVPQLLRNRDRAVTPEDFEVLTVKAGEEAIAQCRCLGANESKDAGVVQLLVVPQADKTGIERAEGIHPDRFTLTPELRHKVSNYLDDRKLLGVEVKLQEPEYVGVAVLAEVGLIPAYNNLEAREKISQRLRVLLYRFLNPLTGGQNGAGWSFGRPVYPSDIVVLFQQVPEVQYLGVIQLFELHREGQSWVRNPSPVSIVNPGSYGLVCSWNDRQIRASHTIHLTS